MFTVNCKRHRCVAPVFLEPSLNHLRSSINFSLDLAFSRYLQRTVERSCCIEFGQTVYFRHCRERDGLSM